MSVVSPLSPLSLSLSLAPHTQLGHVALLRCTYHVSPPQDPLPSALWVRARGGTRLAMRQEDVSQPKAAFNHVY